MIDAHLHLCDIEQIIYPWISEYPQLNRSFLTQDYIEATANLNISQMIFVQYDCVSQQALDEVDMISEMAQRETRIAGIVAFAPLNKPNELDQYLEQLSQFSLVKGVRCIAQGKTLGFSITKEMIEGTQKLIHYNLTSDICIKQEQIQDIITLVKNCPNNIFILDHIAKPNIADGNTEQWFKDIKELATFPNIFCKISGVVTEAGNNWTKEMIKPYILHSIDCFGENRIIFGGDWPVVYLTADYHSWLNTLKDILNETTINQKKFFIDNAKEVYKI